MYPINFFSMAEIHPGMFFKNYERGIINITAGKALS
jgi:hypothetical protein